MTGQSISIDDLKQRIDRHLRHFDGNAAAVAAWSGYIAALLEYGHISGHVHDQLREMLPGYPASEIRIVFLDLPEDD